MILRKIPATGELLPVIGLGTWQTFDANKTEYSKLSEVLTTMHTHGGRLIDSSPMYGRAETVIGDLTKTIKEKDDYFVATKVWTTGREAGIMQMESSMQKMGRNKMDLMQIHNLVDLDTHLNTLRRWKEEGKIRYIGITHYTDGSHSELEKIIRKEKLDFVQFNYSIDNRHAEKGILKVAADYGVATIINRPFGEGKIFQKIKNKQLPAFARDLNIHSWAQYFLCYIISHPAVTCVIPATGDPNHAEENYLAGSCRLPDEETRKKMLSDLTE